MFRRGVAGSIPGEVRCGMVCCGVMDVVGCVMLWCGVLCCDLM